MKRKAQDKKVIRTNISVPPDLKAEMEKYSDVNWSRVACLAFREYLSILENKEQPLNETLIHRVAKMVIEELGLKERS